MPQNEASLSASLASHSSAGLRLSFPITKIDRERREVWGFASTQRRDQQDEFVDYDATKAAFAEWSEMIRQASGGKSLGNVREMHGPKAVGNLIAWKPEDSRKGVWVGAKVSRSSDGEDAWRKINEGVLNGFSIGAPVAERKSILNVDTGQIETHVTQYRLAELSLVDNPANPDCYFQEVKLLKSSSATTVLDEIDANASPRGATKQDKPRTDVQTLIFSKDQFDSAAAAQAWARDHGFSGTGVDETESSYRLRQRDPGEFQTGSFRTIPFKPGVSAVIGRPKGQNKETKMTATGKAEKKDIGPQTTTGSSPGAQNPLKPTVETGPTSMKDADAGAHDDATEPVSPPEGQGKDADADVAVPPPTGSASDQEWREEEMREPEHAAPPPIPPARKEGDADADVVSDASADADAADASTVYSFCAMCGAKMAEAEAVGPVHRTCKEAARMKAAGASPTALAKILGDSSQALAKVSGLLTKMAADNAALQKTVAAQDAKIDALEKTVTKIAKTPLPGGPARTELPDGIVAVEKGASAGTKARDDQVASVLEKMAPMIADPMARDAVMRQVALSSMKKVLRGE